MDHHYYIKQIVEQMFDKIKLTSTTDSITGWTNEIELQSDPKNRISYKTAERAHKKYIENDDSIGKFKKQSIDNFCKFIGYEDYKDYLKNNIKIELKDEEPKNEIEPKNTKIDTSDPIEEEEENNSKKRKWILTLQIIIVSALTLILYQIASNHIWKNKTDDKQPIECMAWAKDHYEITDCGFQLHPDHGTKVEPFLLSKSKMKKIEVDASTTFFSEETGKPLVWYYKTKEDKLEYFTSPGLHPVNGETLKKITEGMIQKYVPIHKTQPDSFISNENENSINKRIAVLILNDNDFDNELVTNLKSNYLDKNSSVINLRDSNNYQKSFISKFNPNEKLYLFGKQIKVDTLVLGTSAYHFSKDIDIQNMITCNLNLELTVYVNIKKSWNEINSKTIKTIGSGYTNTEAKINAIKKINYD
ncbi:hypothetical protein [Psychroserpens mesophilus]|uniref:hypothetical protein n=1 Tax=Psychroserpens mesophilus TaxID=325473 RepID=UPI00058B2DA5|nr:hypothetical protein [Psychroserpens mesophilus]